MLHPFFTSVGPLVLGTEPRQRRALSRYLLSASVYAFSLLVQLQLQGTMWSELAPPQVVLGYVAVLSLTVSGFYVAIRSGFSRRFADPSLTVVQMGFAIVALAGAYLINPYLRGMLLMIVALVLIFGAFTLTPRNCRRLGWFSVTALGLAMGAGVWLAPQLFVPQIEALHFVFSLVVLPTIAVLAGQLSRLRANLRTQRGELSEALARIRILATRDDLTGLPNRRHAQDLLAHEATRAHRERAPLCLCLIDLDHFKRVNDTLGHAAGDEVLRLVAHQSKPLLRDTDVLTRWGGEEFLLLLPETSLADAERVVERLRQHLSSAETWRERPELRVTFSGGITAHHEGESMQETIARADDMLYRAKTAGRDRVLLAA
ncbi:MAG: GGDEF domain-containing protein [Rhizobacter sp.]|nr:GGDEF domain-containing protein [Rhizobacter sp.]